MPNWCSNNLTITGKVEDVKAMFKAAKVNARGGIYTGKFYSYATNIL